MGKAWDERSRHDQRAVLEAWGAIYGGEERVRALSQHPALEDDAPAPRARPTQREHVEGLQLVAWARSEWWGNPHWFRHHEQAVQGQRAGRRRQAAGQSPGWPDYTLIVPGLPMHERPGLGIVGSPILAALELKAPQHAPKRAIADEWWLEWGAEMWEQSERGGWEWDGRKSSPRRHGVSAEQAISLWTLSGSGFRTKVAYGASEAFEWLSRVAGER